ncbi:hypothetical protein HH214_11735 [Mucilaginibacter robiniae]|uniref:Uncharacterized protein n=1 Tax=Mucilaginibacter robiniae TaxID=2728022 RepID=A0A7L5E1U4_9SPHI|nr:hypothetical protein [Mucilaginibacter robiniae]QJD96498.1 hypothetical protein HH214_11735 [Mucilaginibacter robiniae]
MKKLIFNQSPFVLLLVPVLFALIMGISYQVQQAREFSQHQFSTVQATSLFYKGVQLVKTVCSVSKLNVW